MLQFKKYLDLIIINVLFLVIAILLYLLTYKKTEILAAVLATGISLSLGFRQYRTENDKIFKLLLKIKEQLSIISIFVLKNICSSQKVECQEVFGILGKME